MPLSLSHAAAPAFRSTLVRLVLACVLPLAGCAALLIVHVYQSEQAGLAATALNRARAVALSLDLALATTGALIDRQAAAARVLAGQRLPPSWRVALIDTDARILARSHDPQGFVGKLVMPDLRQRIAGSAEGYYESLTLDGVGVLTVYSHAGATGRAVALGIPLAELRASLHRGIGWLILCTLAATALGLVLASLIARRLAASLQGLTGPAAALGGDAPLVLPPLHFAEARLLGEALAAAQDKLMAMRDGLRSSEQRLDLATHATGIGIWVRSAAGTEIWASAQWRRLFQFGSDDTITLEQVFERIHPDDRAAVRATLLGIGRQDRSYDIEYRLALPGQTLRWIASRGRFEAAGPAGTDLVLGISSDVSNRKLAELALQRKQEQIVHLSRVSMMGELSGALAHEINQPLTSILSNAQAAQRLIAQRPAPLAAIGEILVDIAAEDRRAAEVIRRLRGLLRNSEVVRESVHLATLVDDVLGLLRNELLNREIGVERLESGTPAPILADRIQLQQVLINLIVNGCDAIDSAAAPLRKLVLAIAHRDDGVSIAVRDSGAGIAAARLDALFDPFQSTKPDGMGLGLSICRTIIGAHGGRIDAANGPGGGACFTFHLPRNA